ncbi:imelysin family protein [Roseibium aestuarii]|uniref:Imelysin family protein n=1 Tax=Roseibium aestuarii TaxID=2600299 RepID=A0ABW4K0S8_9HYPH|nr:imelysin family protein [Roseibium aestuarii]
MRKLTLALLLLTSVSAAPPAGAQGTQADADLAFAPYVSRSIEGYIRPATDRFEAATADLPEAIDGVCNAADDASRDGFARAYRDVVVAFGGISFLRFGPVIENNRLESIAFMPDPRGISQRQIRKALAARDTAMTSAEQLRDKSVALQGLTALQLLAFDGDGTVTLGAAGDDHDFICDYSRAIAENVHVIAANIQRDWADPAGYSAVLTDPTPAHDHVRTHKKAIEEIFNAIATGFIVIKDQDLLPALGDSLDTSRPHRLPFARSGNAAAFIQAELDGLEQAIAVAHYDPDLPEEFTWVPGSLTFEFANARRTLASLDTPLKASLTDPATYEKLKLLTITINSLRDTTALSLAGAMNFTGGFNALDGD